MITYVKKSLWRKNIRVKDASIHSLPYDLLIEEKYKMKVLTYEPNMLLLALDDHTFDILAIVFVGEINNSVFYIKAGKKLDLMKLEPLTVPMLREHFTKKIKDLIK